MILNLTIYASKPEIPKQDILKRFAASAEISALSQNSFRLEWENMELQLNLMPQGQIQQHLQGLLGFASQMGASPDMVKALSQSKQVFGCVIQEGSDDEGVLADFILGLTEAYQGYFFAGNAMYNANNSFVFGFPNSRPRFFPPKRPPASDLSNARKQRSNTILKQAQIPYIEHLPVIEDENQAKIRSKETIAYRGIALAIVASHALTPNVEMGKKLAEEYRVSSAFSPIEFSFMKSEKHDERSTVLMSWRYESCYTLLWALGFIKDLGMPSQPHDASIMIELIKSRSIDAFLNDARLRPVSELLDAADLAYRMNWAVADAHYQGKALPQILNPGVVYERHYAFNWIRSYGDADWDDVPTDT